MTKEEKIKEAYADYWIYMSSFPKSREQALNNDGWIFIIYLPSSFDKKLFDFEQNECICRPKSLKGIENNNCWIKVESETDLPKEHIDVILYDEVNGVTICYWCNLQMCFKDKFGNEYKFATHYQPILKPKPPLF